MNYNLLEEKWIPILWKEGKTGRVGVITALEQASEIRCITLASPLDLFAMHRFVLTLLYWKASLAKGVEHVRDTLLESRKIPCKVLNGIKKEGYCFDLFNNNAPFLQDPSIRNINITEKDKKSAGSFFAECATGTNIAHFHHGDDDNMRLCLPCAALGMLRVVPWSQAGGAGLTPSVHNAPPIMAIAIGDNLAKTLGLNLVPLDVQAGKATWSGQFKPTNSNAPIPYLEALTWNPRRILLPSPQKGTCWYCGQADVPTVGKIVYMKNKNTKKQSKVKLFEWQDPAAFYVEDFKTIKSTKEKHAEEGRDLLLVKNDSIRKSTVILKNADHNRWLLVVPCTNPANNKTFDHRQLELKDFSSKTIQSILPSVQPPSQGLDGWKQPKQSYPSGNKQFVLLAARLLTNADWGTLSNASFRDMHDSPAAFDVFSGLYWGLLDKNIKDLPSRNVAWLMLKLMAVVPTHSRVIHSNTKFNPLQMLPKRQINERDRTSPYPVSFPLGPRLEAALRETLDSNLRKQYPEPIDWIGLCSGLNQLIN